MLKGFEEFTHDITEEEKAMARILWKYLTQAKDWVTNKDIRIYFKTIDIKITDSRVRKLINWMHVKGHLPNLIASSKGYKFATTKEELENYSQSLRGRIDAINGRFQRTIADIKSWEASN